MALSWGLWQRGLRAHLPHRGLMSKQVTQELGGGGCVCGGGGPNSVETQARGTREG